ncbi:TetR/AcrR family transcriptional regulator [Streptomyces sp. NA04227]|uniref:TetR/AcrR family transcriptional regulator n=1 Tax=Streptomyces sp. NA04227 TaxID=2742136 RepID=UPI001590DB7D|nr:TetR/AcrR family transcriptional regulator [Streptomyces sp. NA04227]QKW08935.1 TetR/AcrR family transcriptional regulator [Streptomyces sp. NA04227]
MASTSTTHGQTPAPGPPPKRVTRRRAQTRQRLLDAALHVFAEEGFGRSTVDKVCERAGFTRGAFYSNFTSLDELFLAMWEQRADAMLHDLRAALDGLDASGELSDADPDRAVQAVLRVIPVDDAWYRVTAEFTAHALRNPPLRRVMAARERAILEALMPLVEQALARAGRRVADRAALGHALIAVHDGTSVQMLIEPGVEDVRRRREELFGHVLRAYSTEIGHVLRTCSTESEDEA